MRSIRGYIIAAALVVMTAFSFVTSGRCAEMQGHGPMAPINIHPEIMLIGTIYPLNSKPSGNVITLQVRDKEYLFKIKDALNMSGTELGFGIVNDLVPRRLRLVGDNLLIDPLLRPDVEGKLYSMQGSIFISDNLLYLNAACPGDMFENRNKTCSGDMFEKPKGK